MIHTHVGNNISAKQPRRIGSASLRTWHTDEYTHSSYRHYSIRRGYFMLPKVADGPMRCMYAALVCTKRSVRCDAVHMVRCCLYKKDQSDYKSMHMGCDAVHMVRCDAVHMVRHVGNNISETYPRRIGQGLNDTTCILGSMVSSLTVFVIRRG